jgi:hypothetical protein
VLLPPTPRCERCSHPIFPFSNGETCNLGNCVCQLAWLSQIRGNADCVLDPRDWAHWINRVNMWLQLSIEIEVEAGGAHIILNAGTPHQRAAFQVEGPAEAAEPAGESVRLRRPSES